MFFIKVIFFERNTGVFRYKIQCYDLFIFFVIGLCRREMCDDLYPKKIRMEA